MARNIRITSAIWKQSDKSTDGVVWNTAAVFSSQLVLSIMDTLDELTSNRTNWSNFLSVVVIGYELSTGLSHLYCAEL